MQSSRSRFLEVRGLRYHVREWGREGAPKIFMLHGFQDQSASFQFLVDALQGDWHVLAPDWRGFGLSEWADPGGYGFPDYLADFESLIDQLQPDGGITDGGINFIAHSLAGGIAAMYSGIRPARVKKLVLIDSFGLRRYGPEEAKNRSRRWLLDMMSARPPRDHADFAALAERMRDKNPRLSAERAAFLAQHAGRETESGRVALRSDPAHRLGNPFLMRHEEARACWRQITAPVLSLEANYAGTIARLHITLDDILQRRALFRDMRVVYFPEAGHMLHHECPEQLAAHIEPFLLEGEPPAF